MHTLREFPEIKQNS